MRRKILIPVICLAALLFLGAAGLPGIMRGGAADGATRCLLIGCDRFVSMPGLEPASANNVDTMAVLLTDFLPEGTKITRLVNGPGTVSGFEQLAADTFRDAKDGDISLVYISTHGLAEGRPDGRRMSLLLSDGTEEERLTAERLREIMDRVPGRKILILDACHSGAVIGRGWEGKNFFEDSGCTVLVSSGALEDSWFWNSETDEYTGTGYFTSAMDRALRCSDPEQLDTDASGGVSVPELTVRLRGIHGASTVYCYPESGAEDLFRLPADRKAGSHLQGVAFGETVRDGDALILPISFRAGESVRVMYQLVPGRNGRWDFEHAVRLPDREKTGLIRGMVSPGEKERKIRLTVGNIGEDGRALMQIVTYSGDGTTPSLEAGKVISMNNEQ